MNTNKFLAVAWFVTGVADILAAISWLLDGKKSLGAQWLCIGSMNLCLGAINLGKSRKSRGGKVTAEE
ncbi:MAG: hypothetical protein LUC35_09375 [Clostridiales bacterium]|nr:hypothetical protein [Clostridiales bacterium]MCD8335527.1 hypothetical protein [Clostridiales bacterium]